ncbi:MAG TPA: DNA mismatch repair protein MutS, partial [Candidatus Limnocylindrales bacterium]|nr:DNA mismatch repair protein MutS [Candidatus Limnocylindrales bacterium]
MNRTSPMMEQYRAVKEQHPDKLLLFQVGDFYELFYEDAELAAREMEIALTSRGTESEKPIPLAGVPIHAADVYLNKLLSKGYKVVICEQVEEASQAKGLVRREVTRILTPGTVTDPEMLEESRNNYLALIIGEPGNHFGLAIVDVSTGDFRVTEKHGEEAWEKVFDELRRLQPAECICSSPEIEQLIHRKMVFKNSSLIELLRYLPDSKEIKDLITDQWGAETWESLNLSYYPLAASAGAAALTYLQLLQHPTGSKHFHRLELYFTDKNMVIDNITSRNLELTQSLREGNKQGSLLGLLDRCMTAMGRRLLRRWIELPLLDARKIEDRWEAVAELLQKPLQRREMRRCLQNMFDLERFCGRLSSQRINARDLVYLKNTLRQVEPLKKLLGALDPQLLQSINSQLPSFDELINVIHNALVDDPPLSLREGGLIRPGYNKETDRLKSVSSEGNNWLIDLEQRERQRTGIKSLRIGYNRNFGYYIEVSRTNLNSVPLEYHRKQTLVNAERYTTEELHDMEAQITGARDKLAQLEYSLFEELRAAVSAYTPMLLDAAQQLACLDCIQSLSEVAERHGYCRPRLSENNNFRVKQGRHPVVEHLAHERFVPNDIVMDKKHYVLVITGPNMAGKSTYIRSAALISIMAQMGSFVPAAEAELPI